MRERGNDHLNKLGTRLLRLVGQTAADEPILYEILDLTQSGKKALNL